MVGASDGPVTKSSESSAAQRSSRVVSKAPTSQKSSMSSDTAAPPSPAKGMLAFRILLVIHKVTA